MNRKEIQSFFEGKLNEYRMIDSRIEELRKKLQQAKTIDDDSLMQINVGICVFSVTKELAIQLLTEAIDIEINYHTIMQGRFNRAVGVLNGEEG